MMSGFYPSLSQNRWIVLFNLSGVYVLG